ncbi:DISARM system SNF2-like helicase DrmD [Vibrio chaetopteri]|uniref:DISARM system SNF2-like helicase DrmD n=1 Tax=Vibrio chaetopteri TaxID=3016528 RepID=UPI003AB5FC47
MTQSIEYSVTPEPGQLVEVRKRQWIVANVNTSQLPTSFHKKQNYVTLSSIDEDGLGEELEVIWEIEPGAHIIEKSGLPDITGFDDASKLDAFLDAVRWGAATNADRGFLQAPFRSGVSIENFQLDPLVRAINMARVNLLIADDVGLGKTIEAGLVIQEMLLRHRARTVLIICPASLQLKWQDEMQEKFGLEFKLVNTEYVKQLRRERGIHANPWTSFPRLIASQDWIKSGEGLRLLRETMPARAEYPRKFDMLVIDEAHNIAPSGSANYAVASQRTKIIREIAPHFQHKLFLTATPHNGYTESFTSLLEILDDQRFSRNILPDEKQLQKVMIRRLKTDLVDENGEAIYPKRKLQALEVNFTELERSMHQKLNQYAESRELSNADAKNAMATKFVNGLLKKRLFSSPASFASTLEKHINTLNKASESTQTTAIEERILRKAMLKADEDYANDQDFELAQEEAIEEASSRTVPLSPQERALLNELRSWAQAAQYQSDSKADAICSWINRNLKDGKKWNNQRVILFTEYRTTQQWLEKILTEKGLAGKRLAIINGGMDHEEREDVKAAFQTHPEQSDVRILLATDAASEGIDLQNHCNCLIHLEIPYNPNVMEQRNGRIDRHGQKAKEILIWHPVDAGSATDSDTIGGHKDDIIRALIKLESMREDMGSVNPVIAPQMAGLIEGSVTELNTLQAEAKMVKARKAVRAERDLQEKIKRLHQQLISTQEDFHLTPEHVFAAVQTALEVAQKPSLKPTTLAGTPEGSVYIMPEFTGSWAPCNKGLRHPFTKQIRPITFDHNVAKGRDDVVLVHLNHRLVQMCLRLLRSKVWEKDDKLHRVTVRSVPSTELQSVVAIVASRLVVVGGTHNRLHEEITYAGGYLKDSGYSRERGVNQINTWLELSTPAYVSQQTKDALKTRFTNQAQSIHQSVEARSKERLTNLESTLGRLKQKEIDDITTVLDELDHSIGEQLSLEGVLHEQLSLFGEDERTEVRKDRAAIEARQQRIESDKKAETEAIEKRYANYIDRTFPVAVIFLVPDNLCEAN